MLNTIISILIAVILLHFCYLAAVFGQSTKYNTDTTKIKADLTKRGIGDKSKVKIELHDGSEIKGYIAQLNPEDDFVIADSKTNYRTTIVYGDVAKV